MGWALVTGALLPVLTGIWPALGAAPVMGTALLLFLLGSALVLGVAYLAALVAMRPQDRAAEG